MYTLTNNTKLYCLLLKARHFIVPENQDIFAPCLAINGAVHRLTIPDTVCITGEEKTIAAI